MRVLFLTSTFPRFDGDSQAGFVAEQARAWKHERPSDEITILAPHDSGAAPREDFYGIEILRFRYFWWEQAQKLAYPAILPNIKSNPWLTGLVPFFIASQYFAARRIIREKGIDLVYAHWVMPQGLVAYILNKRMGVSYVLQNHSSDLTIFGAFGPPGRALAKAIIHRASQLFVVNAAQLQHAISLFRLDQQESISRKITTLPMGVTMPRSVAVSHTKYVFGSISRLSRKKGIEHLIAAAEALGGTGQRYRIGIAGDGEDSDRLRSMTNAADIEFVGFVSGDVKERFLQDARVLIIPSVAAENDVEGLPVALLEALCRGKPVIATPATNIKLLPEWEKIRHMVFLVDDPRDVAAFAGAMQAAAADTVAEASTAERLRSVMSRYLWPNLIREYLAAIRLVR